VNDNYAIQLGMKFQTSSAGKVYGVRFYKGSQNVGTHIGYLWTSGGTLLGQVRFTNETSSGWQQAIFPTPIDIDANTTYVVSFFAPIGYYSANGAYFGSQIDNSPLHGLASGSSGGNGIYRYDDPTIAGQVIPSNTYNSTNYWVDVVFKAN
jgi:hypothetical protein